MWVKVDEVDIQAFADKLASEETGVYADFNKEPMIEWLLDKMSQGYEAWRYDDDKYSLCLFLGVKEGVGRLCNCSPVGVISGKKASEMVYQQIADRFLELGVTEFIARSAPFNMYKPNKAMKAMLPHMKKIDTHPAWENTSLKEKHEYIFSWKRRA